MDTPLTLAGEPLPVLFEVLIHNARPLEILTALTLITIAGTFAPRRTTPLHRLIVLWISVSLSVVLWTECVIRLYRSGIS